MKKKNKVLANVLMQLCIFLFATSNIFFKFASNYMADEGIFSMKCMLSMALGIFILMCYAFFWQQLLKYYELNVANAIKTMYLLWGVFYAIIVFKEKYELNNFIGLALIILGIILIVRKSNVKEEKQL